MLNTQLNQLVAVVTLETWLRGQGVVEVDWSEAEERQWRALSARLEARAGLARSLARSLSLSLSLCLDMHTFFRLASISHLTVASGLKRRVEFRLSW